MAKANETKESKERQKAMDDIHTPEVLAEQQCPTCGKKTLTLSDMERDVPYFGKVFLFSMDCPCGFYKADVETEHSGKPVKVVFEVTCEEDMKVRVIKSSTATIKIPRITTIEPGAASNGYVTNLEGIFNRVKTQIEKVKEDSDDKAERTKAKNLLKKLRKIMWGEESIKITIEDPNGNSMIVSDKAEVKFGK